MFENLVLYQDHEGRWSIKKRFDNKAAEEDVKAWAKAAAKRNGCRVVVLSADEIGVHFNWSFDEQGRLSLYGG